MWCGRQCYLPMWKQHRWWVRRRHWLGVDTEVNVGVNMASRVGITGDWSMCTLMWLVDVRIDVAGQCTRWCGWSMCTLTWLVNIEVDVASRCGGQRGWSDVHGANMAIDLWVEGWARGIEIQTWSFTYLAGLPLLGSPLVISGPSVCHLCPPKVGLHRWKMCRVCVTWRSSDKI